jgi:Tfp pilus assembly protein PilO
MSRILVPLALLISSVGLYFSYISPTYTNLGLHREIEKRLVKAEQDFKTFELKREELAGQYSAMKRVDLDRLDRILPDGVDAVQTIIDIDNLARVNNLRIDSFTLPKQDDTSFSRGDPNTPTEEYTSSEFILAFTGAYQDLKNFLTGIESSLMLIDVTELTVNATVSESSKTDTNGGYEYQIAFRTYKLQ